MRSLRALAERLSRGVVLRRRLPRRYGRTRLYVAPECAGLKFWRHDLSALDRSLFALVDELVAPGMSVWDIGANVGLFTYAAAHRSGGAGYVLAVDPDTDNTSLLLRSRQALDARHNARVEVLAAAIGAPGDRIGRLMVSSRSRSANALVGFGTSSFGAAREERPVPLFTLDELLTHFPPPDVLKIDVEGAEQRILEGAARLLREWRPVIALEVSHYSMLPVSQLLRAHNYRIHDGDEQSRPRRELPLAPWNTLALPA